MARGFESKDVEFQQSEASRSVQTRPPLTPDERERDTRRRTIELALSKARAERKSATHTAHRAMLDQAIQALTRELEALA
jgi:hypothetical protein